MGSFIKFIEMGGGVPIPITSDMSEDEMLHVLYHTNGLLIPGGVIPLTDEDNQQTEFMIQTKCLYEHAKLLNDHGVHYPIIGLCLGIQMIQLWEAPFPDVLKK